MARGTDNRRARGRVLSAFTAALLVASCADDAPVAGDEPEVTSTTAAPATTTAPPATTPPADPVPEQTVQDFVIHVDLSVVTDDDLVSIYGPILARAADGAGEGTNLDGDFTFAPVDSLDGDMVDADGAPLPSISVDFALLTPGAERGRWARDALGEIFSAADEDVFVEALATAEDSAPLLVEIATADLTQGRTHVGPGDRALLDATFVDTLEAGDELVSVQIFGVTLPDDPEVEQGMTPHELFAHRWNEGLVRVLGDGSLGELSVARNLHVVASVDGAVPARPGASRPPSARVHIAQEDDADELLIIDREAKEAVVDFSYQRGFELQTARAQEWIDRAQGRGSGSPDGDLVPLPSPHVNLAIRSDVQTDEVTVIDTADGSEVATLTTTGFVMAFAAFDATVLCNSTADVINGMNAAGGLPVVKPKSLADSIVRQLIIDLSARNHVLQSQLPDEIDLRVGPPLETPPGPVMGCTPPPGETPTDPDINPTGGIFGDVHLRTFDNRFYDTQAVGEFLLFDNGTATAQMRAEPWADSDSASVATALAFRVGEQTVSIHHDGEIWIDDEPAMLTRGLTTELDSGRIMASLATTVIEWDDGTVARVGDRAGRLLVAITPGPGTTRGLLGDNDGTAENDFVASDGEVLPPDLDEDFDRFYADYVDTWRIDAADSLFHYADGEDTATFTNAGFPANADPLGAADSTVVDEAETLCRLGGISDTDAADSPLFDACVLDLVVTGDAGFVYDAVFANAVIASAAGGSGGSEPAPVPLSGNGESTVTIGSETIAFGAEPPIVDPNGVNPRWQCQVDDGSFSANSRFSETPTRNFEIDIRYSDAVSSPTGNASLSVTVMLNSENYAWVLTAGEEFADAIDNVMLDGATLTATGSAYLNADLNPARSPLASLDGDPLDAFALVATCEE